MRGGALIYVLMYHASGCVDTTSALGAEQVFYLICGFGFTGVNLFFLLSTFLLTTRLLDEEPLTTFYAKRCRRLLPGYFVFAIVACAFLRIYSPADAEPFSYEPFVATFTMNYLPAVYGCDPPGWYWLGHLWSISVGVQFFLVWPLVVRALLMGTVKQGAETPSAGVAKERYFHEAKGDYGLGVLCVLLIIAAFGFRLWLLFRGNSSPYPEPIVFFHLLSNLDSFAVGGLLACAARRWDLFIRFGRWCQPVGWLLAALAAGLILFAPDQAARDFRIHAFIFTIVSVMYGLFVMAAMSQSHRSLLVRYFNNPVLQFAGKYSLGIYLFHWPIMALLKAWLGPRFLAVGNSNLATYLAFLALVTVCTVPLAMASWKWIEQPLLSKESADPV